MSGLTVEGPVVPADLSKKTDPNVGFARSYLRMRLAIGLVGILLAPAMWIMEGLLLKGPARLRGSLSEYYYSGARDVFVGALCVVGVLMLTYSTGKLRRLEFWLSGATGVAALGVAIFPTSRPNALRGEACGNVADRLPEGCTVLHQSLGENLVGDIHKWSAILFIIFLAALCLVFAAAEEKSLGKAGNTHGRGHVIFHRVMAALVALSGLWALFGVDVSSLTHLYAGEVGATFAFGASWTFLGWDLLKQLLRELPGRARSKGRRR